MNLEHDEPHSNFAVIFNWRPYHLVLEFVPDTVYRISKHYSKSAQRMPSIYVKLYTYQMAGPGPAACVPIRDRAAQDNVTRM